MSWHINCDDCGMNANASGVWGVDALETLADVHAQQGHTVSIWERGNRDDAAKIRPEHTCPDESDCCLTRATTQNVRENRK